MYAWHANLNTFRNNQSKKESLGEEKKNDRLDDRPKTIVFFFYLFIETRRRLVFSRDWTDRMDKDIWK